ncbi:unnamed protein product [Clonostachys rosea]|uniref:Uncharacterized protein n=1 Tax=Bionectria ochroleuca TaxID=29856 RepID=A0ABY6UB81_BIOOC|nr:unnamed protein product [Clonostachys rosea]
MPTQPPATSQPKTGNSVPQVGQLLSTLNYGFREPERHLFTGIIRNFSRQFVTEDGTRGQVLNQWSSPVHRSGLEEMATAFLLKYGSKFWPCDPTKPHYSALLMWPMHEQRLKEVLQQLFYRKNAHLIKNTKRKTRLMEESALWNSPPLPDEEPSSPMITISARVVRQRANITDGNVPIKIETDDDSPEERSEEDMSTEGSSDPSDLGSEEAQTAPNNFSSTQLPGEMETHNEEHEISCPYSESLISADLLNNNDNDPAPPATPKQPPSKPDVVYRLIESRTPFYEGAQWHPKGNFSDKTLSQLKEELPLPFVSKAKYFGFTLTGPQFLMRSVIDDTDEDKFRATKINFGSLIGKCFLSHTDWVKPPVFIIEIQRYESQESAEHVSQGGSAVTIHF